jgi:hypothetical protein
VASVTSIRHPVSAAVSGITRIGGPVAKETCTSGLDITGRSMWEPERVRVDPRRCARWPSR